MISTEAPYYGSEVLKHNDAARWEAFCVSEQFDGTCCWSAVGLLGCLLLFFS